MTYLPYVEHGDPDGIPVVMLHGVTDSWRSFEPVLPHLPDSIRAIAVTQRGHGDAPKPDGGYLIEDLAADVVELMDDLELGPAIVVGHSMGSWVTQRIAIDHPERLLGVVLAGSFSGTPSDDPALVRLGHEMAALQDPIPAQVAREFQEGTVATPLTPEALDTFVSESLKVPAHVWRATFTGFLEVNNADELENVTTPALLVWGDEDAFISRDVQDGLLDALSDSRLNVYEGVGHAVHWEQPERFAADVVEFSRYCAGQPLSR
ncbi:MAG TPA: alpha/beta hydrolase [Thermoleophilaceae bacterium]